MNIEIVRISDVFGNLFINGKYECVVYEHKEKKIKKGLYEIGLRTYGGFHKRYIKRFPLIHTGMLWVRAVKDRRNILFHVGNRSIDTRGCILPGRGVGKINSEVSVLESQHAYISFYCKVMAGMQGSQKVYLYIREDV